MTQPTNGDVDVANQSFPSFRSDLNSILESLFTNHSGTSAPTTPKPNSFFYDETNNVLKFRNEDNDAYITIMGFDQSADTTTNAVLDTDQTFTGDISFTGTSKVQQTKEKMTISATSATGTINYDALTQAVLYYTTDASANWTVNVRGDGSNTLNSIMSIGESLTVVFLVTQGSTAYYNSAFQVDGSSVTPKWQGGDAPTEGTASGIDSYTYSIIKTADATFTVLATIVDFA